MALYTTTIKTAPGASDANAYATVAQATTYLAKKYGAKGWGALDGQERADEVLRMRESLLMTATTMIDLNLFSDRKYFHKGYNHQYYRLAGQPLAFPRTGHKRVDCTADSGTTTTFTASELNTASGYFEESELVEGSVIVIGGTNLKQHRRISAHDASAGTVTVDTAFSSAIDTTSRALIMYPHDREVVHACIEQAWMLYNANKDNTSTDAGIADLRAAGVQSASLGGISVTFGSGKSSTSWGSLCPEAQNLLRAYRMTTFEVGRG